jgi:hypothetical protein
MLFDLIVTIDFADESEAWAPLIEVVLTSHPAEYSFAVTLF